MTKKRIKTLIIYSGIILIPFVLLVAAAPKLEVKAKVIHVADGDTFVIHHYSGTRIKCRLAFVDAPETPKRSSGGQPFGEESKAFLSKLILDKDVIVILGAKTYDRRVCQTKRYLDNLNISHEMVRSGLAWAYYQYIPKKFKEEFTVLEEAAKKGKVGLFSQSNPEPPYIFRKRKKAKQ